MCQTSYTLSLGDEVDRRVQHAQVPQQQDQAGLRQVRGGIQEDHRLALEYQINIQIVIAVLPQKLTKYVDYSSLIKDRFYTKNELYTNKTSF